MILGWVIEQVNTKCYLSIYLDPFGKNDGYSWFHAAVGKPDFLGISMFLVVYKGCL